MSQRVSVFAAITQRMLPDGLWKDTAAEAGAAPARAPRKTARATSLRTLATLARGLAPVGPPALPTRPSSRPRSDSLRRHVRLQSRRRRGGHDGWRDRSG